MCVLGLEQCVYLPGFLRTLLNPNPPEGIAVKNAGSLEARLVVLRDAWSRVDRTRIQRSVSIRYYLRPEDHLFVAKLPHPIPFASNQNLTTEHFVCDYRRIYTILLSIGLSKYRLTMYISRFLFVYQHTPIQHSNQLLHIYIIFNRTKCETKRIVQHQNEATFICLCRYRSIASQQRILRHTGHPKSHQELNYIFANRMNIYSNQVIVCGQP